MRLAQCSTGLEMNRNNMMINFSSALNLALIRIFGKVPSAESFSKQFNERAIGTTTISRETARKWMRGTAYPEAGKMAVLISWLKLDPADTLNSREPSEVLNAHSPVLSSTDLSLSEAIKQLSSLKKSALLVVALALRGE